jgi:LysM repeat protein
MQWRPTPRLWGSIVLLIMFACSLTFGATSANAQTCGDDFIHVVQSGETLSGIARQYGVSQSAIMETNSITDPNLIFAGQRLVIPGCVGAEPTAPDPAPTGQSAVHVVQGGETLSGIATRYGVTVNAIMAANNIADPNLIFVGQRLVIPAAGSTPAPATPPPGAYANGAKRIEVNLSTQWMYAFAGDTLVWSSGVSTGRDGWNTPTGTFKIYAKYEVQDMQGSVGGESWYVPDVPHAMYIFGGVALHGTYWHNAFGTGARLSHGCINLPLDVAASLYAWAPVGTPVWVHY